MTLDEYKMLKIPDVPGVYQFIGAKGKVLYVGKATSLKDRVRSYFSATVATRGRHVEEMVASAKTIIWEVTDSVLEALVLESALIKKYQPPANTKEKDNKSFNYLVITKEEFPRILVLRERTFIRDQDMRVRKFARVFGPFPSGEQLQIGLRLIRGIFPFRDTCEPSVGVPCFNAQIGLCPGVCSGAISKKEYHVIVRHISIFFSGKKKLLLSALEKEMHDAAAALRFEDAGKLKKVIFSLNHLNDVGLIRADIRGAVRQSAGMSEGIYRIEAYDVAHLGGQSTVGVMVVVENGVPAKSEYRKFRIKGAGKNQSNDPLNLREILKRRCAHAEWPLPSLIVVDGNHVQKKVADEVLKEEGLTVPTVAVVKDDRHKPKEILGSSAALLEHKAAILLANSEAHRFSIKYHRKKRSQNFLPSPKGKMV
jgi:excinuclease ABC subunit C